jgi:hypothetical protein
MTKQTEKTIIVDHIAIPLSAVSGTLRRSYELAQHEVATMPTSPALNIAKSRMANLATQILREAAANLALKISPRSHGNAGYFEAINKRA